MRDRRPFVVVVLMLTWPVVGSAQNLALHRSIAFAQIAAGGGYESLINLTNRGTATYNGTLNMFQGTGQPWSPVVNGTAINNGALAVTITPGQTVTFDITGSTLSAGFAVITPAGNSLSGLLDGTLTYYIRSSTGAVSDSVGVLPSSEMYVTTIPFDNFSTIALALANLNPTDITVHMKLYSDTNQLMGTFDQQLQPNQHVPQYLRQFFQGVTLTRGRLDLQSDSPVIGTALTQVESGQYSSLPFLPAAKTYTFSITSPTGTDSGEESIWFDGASIQGYGRNLTSGGSPVNASPGFFTGQVSNGSLVITLVGNSSGTTYFQIFTINGFSVSAQQQSGTWFAVYASSGVLAAQGTISFTATN